MTPLRDDPAGTRTSVAGRDGRYDLTLSIHADPLGHRARVDHALLDRSCRRFGTIPDTTATGTRTGIRS